SARLRLHLALARSRSPLFHIRSARLRLHLALHFRPDERLAAVDGVVLAQRMTLELLVEQEAAQVRVTVEADPEHVPHFALLPVGDGPQAGSGGNNGSI